MAKTSKSSAAKKSAVKKSAIKIVKKTVKVKKEDDAAKKEPNVLTVPKKDSQPKRFSAKLMNKTATVSTSKKKSAKYHGLVPGHVSVFGFFQPRDKKRRGTKKGGKI